MDVVVLVVVAVVEVVAAAAVVVVNGVEVWHLDLWLDLWQQWRNLLHPPPQSCNKIKKLAKKSYYIFPLLTLVQMVWVAAVVASPESF